MLRILSYQVLQEKNNIPYFYFIVGGGGGWITRTPPQSPVKHHCVCVTHKVLHLIRLGMRTISFTKIGKAPGRRIAFLCFKESSFQWFQYSYVSSCAGFKKSIDCSFLSFIHRNLEKYSQELGFKLTKIDLTLYNRMP